MLPPVGSEMIAPPGSAAEPGPPAMFGTETMAELYARQGRLAEAIAVYRHLLAAGAAGERRARWLSRVEVLDRARVGTIAGGMLETELPRPGPRVTAGSAGQSRSQLGGGEVGLSESPDATTRDQGPHVSRVAQHRMPLVVHEPVRSGQVIYAENNDLIVLAGVNPGAELVADGNIHVYAAMRGRAFAGAAGCPAARVFCQRLEAELVAINNTFLLFEDIPHDRRGRPGQILLDDGRCIVRPF
jgi:septum site-determining protein MinC